MIEYTYTFLPSESILNDDGEPLSYYPVHCSFCNMIVKETNNEDHENANHMSVDLV